MPDMLEVLESLSIDYDVIARRPEPRPFAFEGVRPLSAADANAAVFVKNVAALSEESQGAVFVVRAGADVPDAVASGRSVVAVPDVRRTMQQVLSRLINDEDDTPGVIDDTARIDDAAVLHPSVSVGPFAIIGKCSIGEDSRVGAYTRVHDGVTIGRRVVIREHCLIGGVGFGFVRDEQGRALRIPHAGGVVIEDDVELFPFVNVDRGTLVPTRIRRGAKIDHYCHVGHNTEVGEDTLLTAGVVLCGSSRVGSSAWIGVGSIVKEGVAVGDAATTGLGAVVLRDVELGGVVAGVPAKPLNRTA